MAKTIFKVELTDVDLSAATIKSIQKEINAVVAKAVLKYKTAPKKTAAAPMAAAGPIIAYKIPPDWIGMIMKNLKSIAILKTSGGAGFKQLTATSAVLGR
jgi:hypothetical protein